MENFVTLLAKVLTLKRKLYLRLNGTYNRTKITMLGGRCGSSFSVDSGLLFKYPPHKGIKIGAFVNFGRNIIIDVPVGAELVIGDRVKLTMDVIIAASQKVEIGDNTQVAEFTSIRDSDHGIAPGIFIADQPQISTPVFIGKDVWIARGVAILRGAHIGDGAVIGANSMVKGNIAVGGIAVGTPAKVVKMRGCLEAKTR